MSRWTHAARALGAAALLASTLAGAQTAPLQDASVDELVSSLAAEGAATKVFRRAQTPDADSVCPGGGATPSAGGGTKNLVVEYADDSPGRVDLAIRFEYASDQLTAGDKRLLQKVAKAMNAPTLRDARFAVAGHTDRSTSNGVDRDGNDLANLRGSCGRALSARAYLISQGVAASRLGAYGFGGRRLLKGFDPTAPEHRRVEIRRAD